MTARESYTPGYTANAVDFMARRTAESHAAFLLPLLNAGQRLLDCGCGPGSITLGLARRVAPTAVVGIDAGAAQLERARAQAKTAGVNCVFREASIYALPFSEGEFDGVFSHALFEHLAEPNQALAEIRRVLKPGGFVALRSPDWGGFVLHPWSEATARALAEYQELQRANHGDVHAGRKLGAWLRAAGFGRVEASGSYEIYSDTRLIAEYLARQLEARSLAKSAGALRQWGRDPEALFAQAWLEAVGWKT